ncbi:MAG: fused MFS/spermidine synthase [Deltaproteobacteria bacterium]|nr:fused MFS/spermidine synthase [Deltaproteobacteria bacterium]
MLPRIIPILLLLTGCTGLLYEVVLSRMLALHLGSSGSSQAVMLATFLGGLAAGAWAVEGPLRKRVVALRRPIAGYAALEAFIGAWALALPTVSFYAFETFAEVAQLLPPGGWQATLAKLTLAAALALPLTGAMGATLPVLAAGVQRLDPERGVQLVSRYYVVNALGAAMGAAVTGFVLIEAFGIVQPLYLGAAVNLAVAIVAWLLGLRAPAPAGEAKVPAAAEPDGESPRAASAGGSAPWDLVGAALATGFVSLCAEVLWTRIAALSLGSSVHAFAFMLTVAIAGISLGSAWSARAVRSHDPQWVLAMSQAAAAAATAFLLLRLDALPIRLAEIRLALHPHPDNYAAWLWRGNLYLAAHLLPSAMALGASFPALLASAQARGAAMDRATARILAANTAGNLLGALGCGFVVMPALGVEVSLLVTFCISIVVAFIVLPRPWQGRPLLTVAGVGLALGPLLLVAAPDGFVLTRGLFRLRDTKPQDVVRFVEARRKHIAPLYRRDGKDATITVDKFSSGFLNFRTNGKSDGGTGTDVITQMMLGHLGILHRPHATRAFTIGLGTGMTAAALASRTPMHVQVVELSGSVLEIAPIFASFNGEVWKHPRVAITIADAREVLRTLPDATLDIVVSEPSNPWVVGVADLFTADSFGRIRRKLKPDGVLVQWLQHYELSEEVLKAILCTLDGAFAHVKVYRMSSGDLALVGSNAPLEVDFAAAEAAFADPGVVAHLDKLARPDVARSVLQLLAGQLCGDKTVRRLCAGFDQPLRELHPKVEYVAPRDFFAQSSARMLSAQLDTRRGDDPARLGDSDLPRYLVQRPLDDAKRQELHKYFIEVNHPFDTSLTGATGDPAKPAKALRKALEGLPVFAGADGAQKTKACADLRRDAKWLADSPHTVLGPASTDANAMAWVGYCDSVP